MNVFVLNTGRCGSLTFARACSHMTNFTSAHESRSRMAGPEHYDYPDNHIEVDNRLSWFLGPLDAKFGDKAVYVHLLRNPEAVAQSFAKRSDSEWSIIWSYRHGLLMGYQDDIEDKMAFCHDYIATVTQNIALFLKDKTAPIVIDIEAPDEGFRALWTRIGAQGSLEAALAELHTKHHASAETPRPESGIAEALGRVAEYPMRVARKFGRVARKLPEFVRKS
jgi:hypothetical protein